MKRDDMGSVLTLFSPPSEKMTAEKQQHFLGIPLPEVWHRVLSAEEIGDKHVIVIGDVHGCLDELKILMDQENLTTDNCIFCFCGDLVNKGPKSCETLRYIENMGAAAVSVRGNHEENAVYRWMKYNEGVELRKPKKWSWVPKLTESDIDFITSLPYTLSIPSLNVMIVHAGIAPWDPLEKQTPFNMTEMRNVIDIDDVENRRSSKDTDEGQAWAKVWSGPKHIYYGHDARRQFSRHKFATGIDTACCEGGYLMARYLTGDKRFVAIKSQQPNKMKRPPQDLVVNIGNGAYFNETFPE